jgi:hypothetical protein
MSCQSLPLASPLTKTKWLLTDFSLGFICHLLLQDVEKVLDLVLMILDESGLFTH